MTAATNAAAAMQMHARAPIAFEIHLWRSGDKQTAEKKNALAESASGGQQVRYVRGQIPGVAVCVCHDIEVIPCVLWQPIVIGGRSMSIDAAPLSQEPN